MRKSNHYKIPVPAAVLSLLVFAFMTGTNIAAAQMTSHHMHLPAATKATKTVDIVRDPADVPPSVGNRAPSVVRVTLTAREVVGQLDPASGTTYRYWTFNGKVPAPMIRVRQGDTVEVTLRNDPSSHMVHSVDFHAALGPRGGAALSQALPGQSKIFTFQATTPGLFVYHCGTPMVAEHVANGMYGLILVEPSGGLPHVDHEYYIMQGEIYTTVPKGQAGLQQFSGTKLMEEDPQYFVFNGAVDALTKEHPLKANIGETLRIFFGDAGPNKPSSLHILGEIFAQEHEAGSLTSPPLTDVQTAMVAPGSAAILQLKAANSGEFTMVDHAMARMAKGAVATLAVSGTSNAALMHAGTASSTSSAAVSGMTQADVADASSKSDVDSASITGAARTDAAVGADAGSEGVMSAMSMHHSSAAKTSLRGHARLAPLSLSGTKAVPNNPKELNGCLTLESDGKVMLKILNAQKIYRLEARPLLFSENANRLVHVTGYLGSVVEVEDPRIPSFVVDTIDELAPNCTAKVSPAVWREISAKNSAGAASTGGGTGAAVTVGMTDMAFTPARIVVKAGQKIVWKDSSQTVHNVIDDAGKAINKADVQLPPGTKPFGSDFLQPGQTFSHVFTVPGTYRYVCTLHELNGMKGVVVVK